MSENCLNYIIITAIIKSINCQKSETFSNLADYVSICLATDTKTTVRMTESEGNIHFRNTSLLIEVRVTFYICLTSDTEKNNNAI